MKKLIIFGRSPFINELKLQNIDYSKYDILCINYPIPDIKVNYVVSADEWVKPTLAPKTEWISSNTGWELIKCETIIQMEKRLSWRIYSSSLAVNFAILRGYKTIYLAGVDLLDVNKPFAHYDGVINTKSASLEGITKEIEYIKELAKDINIYQLNPNAKWLKFRDIGLL